MHAVTCQDQARAMLAKSGQFLAFADNDRYYMLDGDVWMIQDKTWTIYHADSKEETADVRRRLLLRKEQIRRTLASQEEVSSGKTRIQHLGRPGAHPGPTPYSH